ncbi:MAG: hypothetical protein ACREEM_45005 [Blastocatellia bacterium]
MGKTQTAIEYAYRHAAEYDAVWWIRAENNVSLAADYAALAQDLGLPEREAREQTVVVAAVRRWLNAHTRWLLVFDNAERPEELREFLPRSASGHVLITSRNSHWSLGIGRLEVNPFHRDDAIRFLLERTAQTDEASACFASAPSSPRTTFRSGCCNKRLITSPRMRLRKALRWIPRCGACRRHWRRLWRMSFGLTTWCRRCGGIRWSRWRMARFRCTGWCRR